MYKYWCSAFTFWSLISVIASKTLYSWNQAYTCLTLMIWCQAVYHILGWNATCPFSFWFFHRRILLKPFLGIIYRDYMNISGLLYYIQMNKHVLKSVDPITESLYYIYILWFMQCVFLNWGISTLFLSATLYKYSTNFLCHCQIQKLWSPKYITWFSLLSFILAIMS